MWRTIAGSHSLPMEEISFQTGMNADRTFSQVFVSGCFWVFVSGCLWVFIIVFGFRLFFCLGLILQPPLPSRPAQNMHTPKHTLTQSSFWFCYMRETDRWAHSKKALLGCNSLIVCNHPYPTFTSHPKSILDQFHARERNHFSKMENIFSLIICALPVVIKLLGWNNWKHDSAAAALRQLFLPSTNLDYDAGSISFKHGYDEKGKKEGKKWLF